jgi:hypothetical protein
LVYPTSRANARPGRSRVRWPPSRSSG